MINILRPYIPKRIDLHALPANVKEDKGDANSDAGRQPAQETTPSNDSTKYSVEHYWIIPGINFRGIEKIDLLKEPLDRGNNKNLEGWIAFSREAEQRNEFGSFDYPLFYAALKAIKEGAHPEKELIRQTLRKHARKRWLTMLTEIEYSSSGDDILTHRVGMPDQYSHNVLFRGENENLNNAQNVEPYNKLLGTTDTISCIESVFRWVNDTDVYLLRVKQRNDNIPKRVARLDADSSWLGVDCDGDSSVSDSSLGVRLRKKISGH